MRQNILALGLLCAVVPALVFAGTGPRIHFVEQEHDFGDVIHGQSLAFEFSYSNAGDADLLVERVASSCGCAQAMRENPTVPPGASSKISTQIRTFGMTPGKHSKTVAIHSNDPEHPVIALKLLFNVVRHVSIHPETLRTSLSAWDKAAVFTLSATNHGKAPVKLKVARPDDAVEAELEPQEVVVPSGGKIDFRLKIKILGQPTKKYLNGKVVIETDARRENKQPLRYFIWLPKSDGG